MGRGRVAVRGGTALSTAGASPPAPELPSSPAGIDLATVVAGLPPRFVERLGHLFPAQLPRVLAALAAPRCPSLRVNTLRAQRAEVLQQLAAAGLQLAPVPWFDDAFLVVGGDLRALQASPAFARGAVFVQGLASMAAALALAPRPGERVLDMAAAPGGKTTLLACLMQGRGRLLANEPSAPRLQRLRAVLAEQGAHFVETSRRVGQSFGRTHPGQFDAVLLDAPCSAEARLVPGASAHASWSRHRIERLARLQLQLLRAGYDALAPGGRLVYSTCTFAPEENELVLARLLRQRPEAQLEELDLPLPESLPGLGRWGSRALPPALARARRLLPGPGCEGFFLARVRRPAPGA